MNVDVAVGDHRVFSDNAAEKVRTWEDTTRMRSQKVKERHLGRRSVEELVIDARFVSAKSDNHWAPLYALPGIEAVDRGRLTGDDLDPRDQLTRAERVGDVIANSDHVPSQMSLYTHQARLE